MRMPSSVFEMPKVWTCNRCSGIPDVLPTPEYEDKSGELYRVAFNPPPESEQGDDSISRPMAHRMATKLAYYLSLIIPDAMFAIMHPDGQLDSRRFGADACPQRARYQIGTSWTGVMSSGSDVDEMRFRLRCAAALTGTDNWWLYDAEEDEDLEVDYFLPEPTAKRKPRRKAGTKAKAKKN